MNEDKHICPKCGKKQRYVYDTFLCMDCDRVVVWDLSWEHKFRKGLIK